MSSLGLGVAAERAVNVLESLLTAVFWVQEGMCLVTSLGTGSDHLGLNL